MTKNSKTIALVGCGNMGAAMLSGWLKGGVKASYIVIEPGPVKKDKRVTHLRKPDKSLLTASVIVLAVKPQVMAEACKSLKPFVDKNALILSIAAGRSIQSFEKIFGKSQPVVRTMPNLPAAIGKGMTVAVANKNASAAQKKRADQLMKCVGKVEWLKNENLINAATALVGNGPAYVFYLAEVLAEAARKESLDAKAAQAMARQVIIGGAGLLESSNKDVMELRRNVTSPGGTTEAAFKILLNGEMQKLFDDALKAGKKRGEELSS